MRKKPKTTYKPKAENIAKLKRYLQNKESKENDSSIDRRS